MSIDIFLKRRLSLLDSGTIWDLINGCYSIFRPDMTIPWTNAIYKVRRDSDNATSYVFLDGSAAYDTYSLSSFISTTSNTTPDATTLGTWLGANQLYVEEQYFITPNNVIDPTKTKKQTSLTLQPKIAHAGVLEIRNTKPTINYQSAIRYLESAPHTALDSANTFTILTVSYSLNATNAQSVISTRGDAIGSQSRFVINNDRRSNRLGVRLRNDSSVNHDGLYLAQINTPNQRVTTVVKTPTNFSLYINNVLQSTTAWSGTYDNSTYKTGAQLISTAPLNGGIQCEIIITGDSPNKTEYYNDLDTYFNIP